MRINNYSKGQRHYIRQPEAQFAEESKIRRTEEEGRESTITGKGKGIRRPEAQFADRCPTTAEGFQQDFF